MLAVHFRPARTISDGQAYAACLSLLLSHPDYTVGSGITPDLLSLNNCSVARGLTQKSLPPVRNFTLP